MTEQFNRILKAFGANRVEVQQVGDGYIQFRIVGLAVFCLWESNLMEWVGVDYEETARSRWLHAISLGKKRDEEGVIK